MEKICEICKKPFKIISENKTQRFCGWKCYSIYRKGMPLYKKGIYKKCKVCDKEFYVQQYRKKKALFCSRPCSAKFNLIKRFIKRTTFCSVCGKEFTRIGIHSNPSKYCSNKCRKYAQYWFGTKVLICIKCGKEFTINKGQQYKRKYCSKECRDQDQRDNGKITQRNGVRRYFQRRNLIKKCQNCGYNEHPEILGIHHKDLNPKNYSLDNLIVLCPNCHALCHNHFINHPNSH